VSLNNYLRTPHYLFPIINLPLLKNKQHEFTIRHY
jgi:hypothetical protein